MSLDLPRTQQAQWLLCPWLQALQLHQGTNLGQYQSPCTQEGMLKVSLLSKGQREGAQEAGRRQSWAI